MPLLLAAEEASADKVAPPVLRAEPTARLDIVVIEDNDDVADLLATWLEGHGHGVLIARTGESGVRLVREERPQLILCDLGLPDIDGVEVCRRVRRLAADYRPLIVALSGWGTADDHRRTTEAGFDRHMVKPITLDVLRDILDAAATAPTAPSPAGPIPAPPPLGFADGKPTDPTGET